MLIFVCKVRVFERASWKFQNYSNRLLGTQNVQKRQLHASQKPNFPAIIKNMKNDEIQNGRQFLKLPSPFSHVV